ncbi:4Fe-4S binding protein [Janthinobacterium sp. 17J80-10]|uniref:4Fe-4S binding protein n=1 Tax=Janthinobacterium sp. 17J80-10 TaxID=2497863 RepID=UPI00100573E4|nr:4Fe-4S binding protein [Janthinobacterium sp. 17J80-10]QAU34967.1 4Fe-4S dicluster domain-containing protein [Janthinobacterium sp. 17J80-10]
MSTPLDAASMQLQNLARTAALLADGALPPPDPVSGVTYASSGRTLVIGRAADAMPLAALLSPQLAVSVLLVADADGAVAGISPPAYGFPVHAGRDVRITGWLGAFKASWQSADALAGNTPAHDGGGAGGTFDLILDLSPTPLLTQHQPPQGYFAPGGAPAAQIDAALQLAHMVGEFEKPKYFHYKERLCAHSRNHITGCSACIDVCSTRAITGAGDRIRVEPHLCMGCGACTTVCPSGALAYAWPDAPHAGRRLKTMLSAFATAGGSEPVILVHSAGRGSMLLREAAHLARSGGHPEIPARLLPLEVHHTASVGMDLWLAAIAYGASGIAVLATDEEAPQYLEALERQMAIAQTILSGLGYGGMHCRLLQVATAQELQAAFQCMPLGESPARAASFHVAADKRNALDFALEHLHRHAPVPQEQVALPVGAPFGAVVVDTAACTLCMSCVGACPESALMDSQNAPQLRFVEKNCVQCGLCEKTCPEQAISLAPRISFAATAKAAIVLNESQPFCCIRCGKPFGTLQMINSMLAKLSEHGAFSGNPDRLKMCGDCRVIDMMTNQAQTRVIELQPPAPQPAP